MPPCFAGLSIISTRKDIWSPARDGQQGLDAALKDSPDLIVLDIMLPKLNGYEVCRLIRKHELAMPIIMLTAKGQEEDIIRGLELGADDYVTKPFSIRELLARVKAFLRRSDAEPTEVHRFGECELNLSSHKLYRDGVEIDADDQGISTTGIFRPPARPSLNPQRYSGCRLGP